MKTLKYALSFIDSNNEEQLISKKAQIVTLADLPLYSNLENAKKAQKTIVNDIKKHHLQPAKHWHDKVIAGECSNEPQAWQVAKVKQYLDKLLIIENGFEIKEVNISI